MLNRTWGDFRTNIHEEENFACSFRHAQIHRRGFACMPVKNPHDQSGPLLCNQQLSRAIRGAIRNNYDFADRWVIQMEEMLYLSIEQRNTVVHREHNAHR